MAVSLGKLFATLGLDTKEFDKAIGRFQSKMGQVSKRMESIGKRMTVAVTLPLLAIGGASIKMASDFETSMTKIETLVGLASDRVNAMKADVMSLSNVTGRSSVELADALFVVTSAGQRGAEAMEILDSAAKASAIGLGETKEIARTVTAVLNAYGKENISAAKATDQLLAIVREGNLEASELAPVLGRVIGLAATLGISFDQVGASIATFTRLGVDSAEAVTGLRGIMNSLIKPTEQGAEALASVGMTFSSLRKEVREKGLAQALIDLIHAFEGDDEALSALIPNVRALSAVLGTAGRQGQAYTQIAQSIASANGLVDQGFERVSQTSAFKFQQALTELKNVGIEIGAKLIPIALKVVNVIRNVVKWFSSLSSTAQNSILALAGIATALGPVLTILGTIGTVLSGLSLPIVGVIAGIAAIAAAWIYLSENWEAVKERLSDWSWWRNALVDAVQFFIETNPFSLLIDGVNEIASFLGKENLLPNPFEAMADALEGLKGETKEYEHEFGSFVDAIKAKAEQAKNALSGLFRGAGGGAGISSGAQTGTGEQTIAADTQLMAAPTQIFTEYLEDFDNLQLKIDETTKAGLNMQRIFDQVFTQMIPNSLVTMTDAIGNALVDMENGFMGVANAALGSIQQIINALLSQAIAAMIAGEAVKGLPGLIAAGIGIAAVKALFSKHTKVNDALITSSGSIIEFAPKDNILAMKDFSNLGAQNMPNNDMSGEFMVKGSDLVLVLERARNKYR